MGWIFPSITTKCKIIQGKATKFIPSSSASISDFSFSSSWPPQSSCSSSPPPLPPTQCPVKKSSTTKICSPSPSTKAVEVALKAGCFSTTFFVSLCIFALIISIMMWLTTTYEPPPETISLPPAPSNPEPIPTCSRQERDRTQFTDETMDVAGGWLQYHENSTPQIGPPTYRNILTDASQNNFFQQQNQPQTQLQQSKQQLRHQPLYNQPPQSQFVSYPMNQQGNCCLPNQPSCQPNSLYPNPQQISNSYQTQCPMPCPPPQPTCGSLSPAVLEQIRNACTTQTAPIFILPNNPMPPQVQPPQQMIEQMVNCPGMRVPCGTSLPQCYPPPSCFPYPVPMTVYNPFGGPTTNIKEITNCNCNSRRCVETCKIPNCLTDCTEEHICIPSFDDTICLKKTCPSAINLQALASQLLAIQGVISCAATRLILRKVSGSNITTPMEETIERARRSINALTQDQLLTESRNAQQINALINLHMTANPPPNVIPILTTIQLKVNLLKGYVENLINCNLMENQSVGAEGSKCLDIVSLSMKCDRDLRTILATLRQKECDERVNFNFAPYHSQRAISECRLRNIESKIRQVEAEIARRRCLITPRLFNQHDDFYFGGRTGWYAYPGTLPCFPPFERETIPQPQCHESPDPFQIEVRGTRRLNLKPHVGSPETTYSHAPVQMHSQRELNSGQQNKQSDNKNDDNVCNGKNTNSQDEDIDDDDCNCCCNCSRSSDDDGTDEDKKKLRLKMNKKNDKNIGKKKTVDFAKENMPIGNIMSTIMPMEIPEKDTDDSWVNNSSENKLETSRGKFKLKQNTVNNNIDENNKKKIISLHNSKTSQLIEEPSVLITHSKKKSTIDISFENTLMDRSFGEIENQMKNYFSNTIMSNENSLNASNSEKIFEEYYMGFIIQDSSGIETSISDGIKMKEQEIFPESNSIVHGTPDCNKNENKNGETTKNNVNVNSGEQKQIQHREPSLSTLNPSSTNPKELDVISNNNSDETSDDLVSGALPVIGNHVVSFGSIITKIATLTSHLMPGESSRTLFGSDTTE